MEKGYENGKIYKIECNITGEVYIGSTKYTLEHRLQRHKMDKTCISRNIINRGDYEMKLIKDYPCNSKYDLEEEEAKYILENDCINVKIPHRTQKEYQQDKKQEINKQRKEYREKNKEEINKKKAEKITCECGALVRRDGLSEHRKSKKHINLMNKI